jgi:hypothetical protein
MIRVAIIAAGSLILAAVLLWTALRTAEAIATNQIERAERF